MRLFRLASAAFLLATMTTHDGDALEGAQKADGETARLLEQAAPDLQARLSRWKRYEMPFDASRFSPRERQLIDTLVAACRDLENLYWRQSDPGAVAVYRALEGVSTERERALRRLLWINGSRWDLIDENRPFLGREPMPPGRSLYPDGLTREEIESYVRAHPDEKKAIYSVTTIVRRRAPGLEAVPYHEAYRQWLEPAARKLEQAAGLSDDPSFSKYLRLLATALRTDDYYPADSAWLDLAAPKFDLIFAPYETYLDHVLGVKGSYGASVLIRNETESRKLELFQKYVAQIQDALPLAPEDRPSLAGKAAPMEVMDAPFRAGDLRHGYQAVADNLPNDPRIHEEKGSKRIFFKNFMDARVNEVVLPVARRLMREDQAAKASADGYLADVMMHEICHGLGPAFSRTDGGRLPIREAIGGIFSALEEAKADVTGMFGLAWLIDRGALPRERLEEYYASYVAGIFRTVRFGVGEAHGRAQMMEFNYLAEQGAIRKEPSGRYAIDGGRIPGAFAALARELLETEARGDRGRAEAWFARYDKMPAGLAAALEAAKDLPVDIDPVVPFPEGVE